MPRNQAVPILKAAALLSLLVSAAPLAAADFTYEGRLDDRGAPANGRYDIQLTLYRDAESGATLAAPVTFPAVEVVGGRFKLEFDAPLEGSKPAWVALAVRDAGGGSFSAIPARTKATLAPATIGACWSSTGDSGSSPAVNFLGTTDAQPLVLRTQNVQSLRIEPSTVLFGGSPITANVIAGSSANLVIGGARGATISGGGVPAGQSDPDFGFDAPNGVTDNYGTVAGGIANVAGDGSGTAQDSAYASVGGGASNLARGLGATIGGGYFNSTFAQYATVAGGTTNYASNYASVIAGGSGNTASGNSSAIGGGLTNMALGLASTIAGGDSNCAGAEWSWAGGLRAKVRPGASPGALTACSDLPSYPGGGGDHGTFVWADSQDADFVSSGPNQFVVRAAGGVGINSAPTASANELSVYGTTAVGGYANFFMRQNESDRGGVLLSVGDASSTNNNAAFYIDQFKPDNPNLGQVRTLQLDTAGRLRVFVDNPVKPTAGSWAAPSDARLKHHVAPLQGSLDRLLALHGVSFEYNADAPSAYYVPGVHTGFVAQDVERVFPEWVSTDPGGYRLVGPQGFEALAVEALRELRSQGTLVDSAQAAEIRALKAEAAELRASEEAMRAQLAELRALLDSRGTGER